MNRIADLSLGVRRLAAAFLTSGVLLIAVAAIFVFWRDQLTRASAAANANACNISVAANGR